MAVCSEPHQVKSLSPRCVREGPRESMRPASKAPLARSRRAARSASRAPTNGSSWTWFEGVRPQHQTDHPGGSLARYESTNNIQRTTKWLGLLFFLGLSTGCGTSYEEQERAHETERRQFIATREQELADFAERHHAIPVQLFPDLSELPDEEPPRTFTAQLQEKIEGSVVAFRGELIDVVRTPGGNYQLVFGSRLHDLVVATLDFDRQGATKVMDDPPDLFSELLVAARIDKVDPIFWP